MDHNLFLNKLFLVLEIFRTFISPMFSHPGDIEHLVFQLSSILEMRVAGGGRAAPLVKFSRLGFFLEHRSWKFLTPWTYRTSDVCVFCDTETLRAEASRRTLQKSRRDLSRETNFKPNATTV